MGYRSPLEQIAAAFRGSGSLNVCYIEAPMGIIHSADHEYSEFGLDLLHANGWTIHIADIADGFIITATKSGQTIAVSGHANDRFRSVCELMRQCRLASKPKTLLSNRLM